MTGAIANLLVDVVIIALLVVTIAYCWVLNRRIRILQDSKGELAQLLKHFDESTQRASESIIALQSASKKIGETIQSRVEKATFMLDDLGFMIEKAAKVSQQMEAGFAVSRVKNRVMSDTVAKPDVPAAREVATPGLLQQEHEPYAEVVTKAKPKAAQPQQAAPASNSRENTLAALQAVIERAKRRTVEPADDLETSVPHTVGKTRSQSEQELLSIIRAGFKG